MRVIRLALLAIVVAMLIGITLSATTYKEETIKILSGTVNHPNILPQFLFAQGTVEGGGTSVVLNPKGGRGTLRPSTPDETCDDSLWEGIMDDVRSPQLPYLTLSHWDNTPVDTTEDVLVLENDKLKVSITPGINGKIYAIYDKINQKDLVMDNRRRGFANIGTLKAWSAGGVEWNWSPGIIGHSVFSEANVFTGILETDRGPMARVMEFDRYNYTTWQVDILLEDDVVWVHPAITNPHDHSLPAYWWTCVAHTIQDEDRVVTPANAVAETEAGSLRLAPWPHMSGLLNSTFSGKNGEWLIDHSRTKSIVWGDFFLRIPHDDPERWLQHVRTDGYTVFHGHKNNGTKFFTWGNNGPGRFMQDFLSLFPEEGRPYDYIELQTGPAATQMQQWTLPKSGRYEWTEYFKGWMPSDEQYKLLQGDDYQQAIETTRTWLRSEEGVPQKKRDEMETFFEKYSGVVLPASEYKYKGTQWGALHKKLLEHFKLPPMVNGDSFHYDTPNDEVKPWDDLVTMGTFSQETLQRIPHSYQTTELWRILLEESLVKSASATWLHYLHLAIIGMERGEVVGPKRLLQQSISLKPNPTAYRCLALLQDDEESAIPYFAQGWESALKWDPKDPMRSHMLFFLGGEVAQLFQATAQTAGTSTPRGAKFAKYLQEFITEIDSIKQDLPQDLFKADAIVSSRVLLALFNKQPERALELLNSSIFSTYGRTRSELIAYSNEAYIMIATREAGRPLSRLQAHAVRVKNPPSRTIGCPYASIYCTTYW